MRKIIAGVFFILGAVVIATGVFLQFNEEEQKSKEKLSSEETNKEVKFNIVNSYNLKDTCTTYNKVPAYIYFTDYTKVSFNYPDCVHEYGLSHWYKHLSDELYGGDINISVSREKTDPKTLLNRKKTALIGYKNEGMYDDVEYADITELTLENGLKAYAFQYNYRNDYFNISYGNQWYVMVELEKEKSVLLDIRVNDNIMSQKAILDIINSIKVEKVESIKISKVDGNYQIGSIKQNSYKKYDHGFIVNFKVNNKYPERETTSTNINGVVFEYEDLSENIYVSYEMGTTSKTILEEAQSFKKVTAEEETETQRNVKNGELIQKEINGKKIIYFINSHDYYSDNKKTSTYYLSYVYYEIEPNLFLKIYISNKNHEINEAFISEFLDFTVEEY